MKRLLTFLSVLCACTLLQAQIPIGGITAKVRTGEDVVAEQRTVVGQWARLNFNGALLTDDGWEKLKPLTSMREKPVFSTIYIVTRYQIDNRDQLSNTITITYFLNGQWDSADGYRSLRSTKTVAIDLREKSQQYTIFHIDPSEPFVSRQAAMTWLQKRSETETSEQRKKQIQDAITQLSKNN